MHTHTMEPIADMLELQPMAGAGVVNMVDTLELQTMAGAVMVDTPELQPTVDVEKPEELQLRGRQDELQLRQYFSEDL